MKNINQELIALFDKYGSDRRRALRENKKLSYLYALADLRENLLETDAIQGTTVASTLIGYSPERIFRTYGEGERGKQTRKTESSAALAKLLAAYTSGDRKDENARYLEVGYPSDFLQQGICIIDTP